jgi:hypothetical protein
MIARFYFTELDLCIVSSHEENIHNSKKRDVTTQVICSSIGPSHPWYLHIDQYLFDLGCSVVFLVIVFYMACL